MPWYLGPSIHGGKYNSDFKPMITVLREALIWSRYNSSPYTNYFDNSLSWQCEFSLGNFVRDSSTIIRVNIIFLKFFLQWWMMSWSPCIFVSSSRKAPVVYHCFVKNTEIKIKANEYKTNIYTPMLYVSGGNIISFGSLAAG